MRRKPKYQQGQSSSAPLSDGRTPGICCHCGKQHDQNRSWDRGQGCSDPDSVFMPHPRPSGMQKSERGIDLTFQSAPTPDGV